MKIFPQALAALLSLTLLALPAVTSASIRAAQPSELVQPQQNGQASNSALQRGYRTGYSDGYQAGFRDSAENGARDYRNKDEYQRADRAYAAAYGPLEDYRDGYQQGFESGYNTGYERRSFDSTVPENISRRGTTGPQVNSSNNGQNNSSDNEQDNSGSTSSSNSDSSSVANYPGGSLVIPSDTVMLVELLTSLSSDSSQRGDRFQARVIEPGEYAGAVIDGRVTRVKRAGKLKGTSELQLSFEQIRMPDNRSASFSAQVIEVIQAGGSGVGEVDQEGGVKGKDKTKDDISTVGASTGIGAIIGAIAGGGKGAAIGAAIGGAIGTGRVLTSSGGNIYLPNGQQLRIRTANEARIQ
ncbi:MAG TPA: hypothetical protein VGB17_00710 [Pyrinomonadaceae bacterium]|jgi:hypothetical protein